MTDSWTDAERLAAEVLASGSDETLRELLAELDRGIPSLDRTSHPNPPSRSRAWRDSDLLNFAVDTAVVFVAVACIAVGVRPLATPIADARPVIAQALEGVSLPAADAGPATQISAVAAVDRPVSASEPISLHARSLEATLGRYRAVADMYGERKLPCSQLRLSYAEVEESWTRYSIVRGRTYGDRLPPGLVRWDGALYEAVRDVDRQFTASGCNRP